MTPTVAITDAELLERQLMPDEEFVEHFFELISHFPAREWTRASFEHGLRYPWNRPGRSYLLRDDRTSLLHELDNDQRAAVLERHLRSSPPRVPLLGFGSNVAPKNLTIKLAHHEDPEDREVLVLAGELQDLDVVASASVTAYGAMPATLAASPGTSVSAAVLLVTATQLTTLTWGEMPYRVGRLAGASFTVEDGVDGVAIDSPLAFVSRWGAFAPDGVPAPLAAIPARDRRARSPGRSATSSTAPRASCSARAAGGGEELTRRGYADIGAMARRVIPGAARVRAALRLPGLDPRRVRRHAVAMPAVPGAIHRIGALVAAATLVVACGSGGTADGEQGDGGARWERLERSTIARTEVAAARVGDSRLRRRRLRGAGRDHDGRRRALRPDPRAVGPRRAAPPAAQPRRRRERRPLALRPRRLRG